MVLQLQSFLPVLLAVPLQLGGAGLVLSQNFHQGAGSQVECCRSRLGVAVLGGHDVEYVGDKQREQRIAGLQVAIAPRKGHFGVCGGFADLQGQGHLHSV